MRAAVAEEPVGIAFPADWNRTDAVDLPVGVVAFDASVCAQYPRGKFPHSSALDPRSGCLQYIRDI